MVNSSASLAATASLGRVASKSNPGRGARFLRTAQIVVVDHDSEDFAGFAQDDIAGVGANSPKRRLATRFFILTKSGSFGSSLNSTSPYLPLRLNRTASVNL